MLSDETIQNKILHRPTETDKSIKLQFYVPLNAPQKPNSNTTSQLFDDANRHRHASIAVNKNKPIRIFRPETLKRAHNDAIMAASIGDLEWLKQTLKILPEIFFDKNVQFVDFSFKKKKNSNSN